MGNRNQSEEKERDKDFSDNENIEKKERKELTPYIAQLKTSRGKKVINKYLVIEIFSMVYERDMIIAKFSVLDRNFTKCVNEEMELISRLTIQRSISGKECMTLRKLKEREMVDRFVRE